MDHGPPETDVPQTRKWADAITADHQIFNDEEAGRKGERVCMICSDRWTHWVQGYPARTKSADETQRDLERFVGPWLRPGYAYTDGSGEISKALKTLNWLHDHITPHRPQTNGVAERCCRRVKEGTSCSLVQSGWIGEWWPEAMSCFCFLRNITDISGIMPNCL